MKLAIMALVAAAAALTAGASPSPAAPDQAPAAAPPGAAAPSTKPPYHCFRSHDIRNHRIGDDRTLYISVSLKDVYRIDMSGSCLAGALNTDPIVMVEPPGQYYICKPIDMDISISRNGFRTPCIPTAITPLSPAEVAALPPKLRP